MLYLRIELCAKSYTYRLLDMSGIRKCDSLMRKSIVKNICV